jgi:hypothetical protein
MQGQTQQQQQQQQVVEVHRGHQAQTCFLSSPQGWPPIAAAAVWEASMVCIAPSHLEQEGLWCSGQVPCCSPPAASKWVS